MTGKFLTRVLTAFAVGLLPSAAIGQHLHGASGLDHGIPDFCAGPTITSARSGSWSDGGTWTQGRAPRAGDKVLVGHGATVTYDTSSDQAVQCVGIEGVLRFEPNATTKLTVVDLLVLASGSLEVGTEAAPIAAGQTATIVIADKPTNAAIDPEQFGTGLVVLGRLRMHGQPRPRTFLRTAEELSAGQTVLTLAADATGWQPGDRLVIPDSRYLRYDQPYTIEAPTTAQVNGRQITLTTPLRVDHPGARAADGTLDFFPYVASLSRNVVIRSQNAQGTRGHIIAVSRADVDVRYVHMQDLGRTTLKPLDSARFSGTPTQGTNQIGRYAFHFHHVFGPAQTPANGFQYTFVGNAVERSTKWAITIHNSHYGLIRDNIVYQADGAGIMTEDGGESYNVIQRNLVVDVKGLGGRGDERAAQKDFGIEGAGIWLRGPNNYIRENVVANAQTYGYALFFGLGRMTIPAVKGSNPTTGGPGTTLDFNQVPILEFSDNENYADHTGMTLWWAKTSKPNVMLRFKSWHTQRYGFYGYPADNMIMDGWVMRGDPKALNSLSDMPVGIWYGDYETQNATVIRADIQNMGVGLITPMLLNPPASNHDGRFTIQDSVFRNYYGVSVETMYATNGGGALNPRTTVIRNSVFSAPSVPTHPEYPPAGIAMSYFTRDNANLIQKDRVFVYDFNRVPGDNFQVFFLQQAPDFVVPTSAGAMVGAPAPGLTNQALWERNRLAIGGQITPCQTRRPEVHGFVCQTTDSPGTTPAPLPAPPRPPRNVRLTSE